VTAVPPTVALAVWIVQVRHPFGAGRTPRGYGAAVTPWTYLGCMAGRGSGRGVISGGDRQGRARQRYFEAALEQWASLSVAEHLGPLTPRRVASAAGRQVGALYHHWPTIDAFHHDLVRWATRPDGLETLLHSPAASPEGLAELALPSELIEHLARETFAVMVERDRGLARFHLFVASVSDHDPVMSEALAESYRATCDRNASFYAMALEEWGRELRPPWTAHDLATVFAGLTDGMALRHLFDPDASTPELFARAVTGLAAVLSAPKAAPAPYDGYVTQLLARPVTGDEVHRHRTAVAEAAVEIYRRRGWAGVTIGSVAGWAGVEARVVNACAGGRDGLAAPIWDRLLLPDLSGAVRADLEGGRRGLEALRTHLERLVAACLRHRSLTSALVATRRDLPPVGTHGINPSAQGLTALVGLAGQVLERAAAGGELDGVVAAGGAPGGPDVADLANALTAACLAAVVALPAEGADRVGALVPSILVAGLADLTAA
jgi:AcrR family transcriptional regulator